MCPYSLPWSRHPRGGVCRSLVGACDGSSRWIVIDVHGPWTARSKHSLVFALHATIATTSMYRDHHRWRCPRLVARLARRCRQVAHVPCHTVCRPARTCGGTGETRRTIRGHRHIMSVTAGVEVAAEVVAWAAAMEACELYAHHTMPVASPHQAAR